MRVLLLCLVVVLSGCNGLNMATEKTFNAMPSAKNCDEVSYVRTHRDILVSAKCTAPVESASTAGIPGL